MASENIVMSKEGIGASLRLLLTSMIIYQKRNGLELRDYELITSFHISEKKYFEPKRQISVICKAKLTPGKSIPPPPPPRQGAGGKGNIKISLLYLVFFRLLLIV